MKKRKENNQMDAVVMVATRGGHLLLTG